MQIPIFYLYWYFSDVLIGFHYVYLLIGMLLSHVIMKFFVFSYYVNMVTTIMVAVNLTALLAIKDPPYYRLKNDKDTNVLDFILTIQDTKRSKICNRVFSVRATACEQWRGYEKRQCLLPYPPQFLSLSKIIILIYSITQKYFLKLIFKLQSWWSKITVNPKL